MDRLTAYHEAGHAIASYNAGIPFIRVTIDPDPETNRQPGVIWDTSLTQGPDYAANPSIWLKHQKQWLIIDFAGRAAEQFVRLQEIPFPSLEPDDLNLIPVIEETAKNDLHTAWERFHRIEAFKPNGHRIFSIEWPELLIRFELEYHAVCNLLLETEYCSKISSLAAALIAKRRMDYDETYMLIDRA